MMGKLIFLSTVVCIIALLLNIDYTADVIHTYTPVVLNSLGLSSSFIADVAASEPDNVKVFTKAELAQYKGEDGGKVYLAVVGRVYDVTKGKRHYGPGGGYAFFSGIDGSQAYVTGKFTEEGLVDDITPLSYSEIVGLEEWKNFYEKDYTFIGKVEGAFYDENGKERPMLQEYRRKLHIGRQEKSLIEKDRQLFPNCNSEWSQDKGGRVWCSNLSGGVQRDWIGVPRMYYTAGNSQPRCACIRTTGPPSHNPEAESHSNHGDLDNPNLNLYPNCDPMSISCRLPDQ